MSKQKKTVEEGKKSGPTGYHYTAEHGGWGPEGELLTLWVVREGEVAIDEYESEELARQRVAELVLAKAFPGLVDEDEEQQDKRLFPPCGAQHG